MDRDVLLQHKAYDMIFEKIRKGEMEFGTVYSVKKVAEETGLSRTSVREALLSLSQEKYIDMVPGRGFQLHTTTELDIWDAFQMRTAIEGYCALYLKQHRDEERAGAVLGRMEHILSDLKTATEGGAPEDIILRCDFDFHKEIVSFRGNHDFIVKFDSYRHRLYEVAKRSNAGSDRNEKSYGEHREIYDLILSNQKDSPVRLYGSVMNHMRACRDLALRNM